MKIVFLSFYKGIVPRGVETFVDELASRLVQNHDITVFQLGSEKNKKYKIKNINLKMSWPNDTSNSFLSKFFLDYYSLKIAQFTLEVAPFLLKENYEIIIPTNGGWQSLFCKIISLIKRSKMAISGQCGPGYDERWNLLCHPDLFISLSRRDELWAKKYLKNVIKIPNGVDLNKFNPTVAPVIIPLRKPIILCASALSPFKRVDLAIKAVSQLENASLLVLGQGDNKQRNYIEKLGQTLLKDRFLLKTVPHDKIAPYFNASDLLTFPSHPSEAFGIVLVEAMATNLPVVATDDEVRKEIIGDAGIFINPENIDEYSAALKKALETNWGDKPRLQAENFSWDKISQNYEKELKKLC